VLFERRLREGIHEGRIVLTFRRWNRCQVVAGHRYRTGSDIIEVDAVDLVTARDIDTGQASDAGYATVKELLADLRGDEKTPLYRIRFHRVDEPDPRDELAAQSELADRELAALTAQLTRMDNAGSHGPWTRAVLTQIADHPATVSTVLAGTLGWDRQDFKLHVRRLKQLGLTISLDVGYRLSPRGQAYLEHTRTRSPH
jgi:predicted metal-dependent enzyme (double-stranded beta helix superfamily)